MVTPLFQLLLPSSPLRPTLEAGFEQAAGSKQRPRMRAGNSNVKPEQLVKLGRWPPAILAVLT